MVNYGLLKDEGFSVAFDAAMPRAFDGVTGMTNLKNIGVNIDDSDQRLSLFKIIEGFMQMPEHYKVVLEAILEQALDGEQGANEIP